VWGLTVYIGRKGGEDMKDLIPREVIENKIYLIRGHKVMLDRDLAMLYGVATKRLKEQVNRNIKRFPELNASEIVVTDCIDDGFNLTTIPEESQDFLIANHVLEHAPNPIQVLINWTKVLKRNGIFFITVPIGKKCFDGL